MSGDDQVRHCDSCRLNVFNTAEMTMEEVENLIQSREGRLCIRIYRRSDGTVITKDCPVGLKAIRKRLARFAGAALAAVLGLISVSFGQMGSKKVDASKFLIESMITPDRLPVVEGTITDVNGAVIPGGTVTLQRDSGLIVKATANEIGFYQLVGLEPGIYSLKVDSHGFRSRKFENLTMKDHQKLKMDIILTTDHEITVTIGILIQEDTSPPPFSFGGPSTVIKFTNQ